MLDELTEVHHSLICAVREGSLERVRELISSYGLSYLPEWSEGYTLLCDAVKYRCPEIVKLLLELGAEVNSKNKNNHVETLLHLAVSDSMISEGYSDIIELLLTRGADVDAQNEYKETPLHLAVENCNETIVGLLLDRGASTDLSDSQEMSPLHCACSYSNLNIFELLLSAGANINCLSYKRDTPLHRAATKNNEKIVLLLLDRGAHLEATNDEGNTPLHCAVDRGSQEVIKLLLDKKANVNAISYYKYTPLFIALQREDEETAMLLLKYGADVGEDNKTPLCLAAGNGLNLVIEEILQHNPDVRDKSALRAAVCGDIENYNEIVDSLMEYGITFDHEDIKDSELLETAVRRGFYKIVECLLNLGADPNIVHGHDTLLITAIKCKDKEMVNLLLNHGASTQAWPGEPGLLHMVARSNWSEGCKILLEHGVNVNTREYDGTTALHYAASGEITKLLLDNGAKIDARSKDGSTALHFAAEHGFEEVVSILLQYGDDVNVIAKYNTIPLHFAVQNQHRKIVDILLDNGANVNAVCENGSAPLLIAVDKGIEIFKTLLEHGNREIVERILKHNLDVSLQDDAGRTALHYAVLWVNYRTVSMLLQEGSDINIITKRGETPLDLAIDGMDWERIDPHYVEDDPDGSEMTLYEKYEFIAQDLKLHAIKLKAAGLHLSEKNLRSVEYNVDEFESEEILDGFSYGRELYEFELECRKELKKMKSSRLGVDLHDVLTTKFPRYILNNTLVRDLESFNYKEFPKYGRLLRSKFGRDRKRIVLLESSKKSLEMLVGVMLPVLPNELVEKILSYLENRDLENLILCSKSSTS